MSGQQLSDNKGSSSAQMWVTGTERDVSLGFDDRVTSGSRRLFAAVAAALVARPPATILDLEPGGGAKPSLCGTMNTCVRPSPRCLRTSMIHPPLRQCITGSSGGRKHDKK